MSSCILSKQYLLIFHVAARARLLRVDKGLVAFTGGSLEFYTGHNQAHQCHNKYYSHHYRDDLSCKKNHDEKLSQMVNVQIARLEFEHFSWVHTTWLSRITPETTAKRPKSLKPTAYNQSPALETKFYRKSTCFPHNNPLSNLWIFTCKFQQQVWVFKSFCLKKKGRGCLLYHSRKYSEYIHVDKWMPDLLGGLRV